MDFLWHLVSKEEKEKIKKEAKEMMDNFAKALSEVEKKEKKGDGLVKREKHIREEKGIKKQPDSFRKIFFENAPNKEDTWIKAEKGSWK